MIVYRDIEQRSYQWYMVRLGIPTASCFDRILTPTGQMSKQARRYMLELLAERVMGCPPEQVEAYNRHIQHGIDAEPRARRAYAMLQGVDVDQVAFIADDDRQMGCSPDGLIGEKGGVEIKCPALHTHIGYMLDPESLVADYRLQVHGCLAVTGRDWWDIASYADWDGVPLVVQRVEADEFTAQVRAAVEAFCVELATAWREVAGQLQRDTDHPF